LPHLIDVPVARLPYERFRDFLDPDRYAAFEAGVRQGRELLRGRVVWNVNSTAKGGGVVELLRSLLAYARGADVEARWVVIAGSPEFFSVTKRVHNFLHGAPGDGGELADFERGIYRSTLEENLPELLSRVKSDDVVILHDPQTAGLCEALKEHGAIVLWRCHVGLDFPNDLAHTAWDFLRPLIVPADAFVFSRHAFAWEGLDPSKINVIPPSIDAFSPKNQDLTLETVHAILVAAGLVHGRTQARPEFRREDGSTGLVRSRAALPEGSTLPSAEVQWVVQVSRWDRLKDPSGVIRGFAEKVAPETDAHLVMAGPDVEAVADDPEGAEVFTEVAHLWRQLPDDVRSRIHLALLPMNDAEENAAIVNALQRRASIVVQKSIAEGFGLTVAEAMWKGRPVVASAVGGIQEQIIDGRTGMLLRDPRDVDEFGRVVTSLLRDERTAQILGREAKDRVRDVFLGPRHLMQYVDLLQRLLA
jgi:trehalose synthase